jgi:two-component system phosphate regulon sensor histidine kinase PhoR
MEKVVGDAVKVMQERADISRVHLRVEIAPDLPMVCGHSKSLERAVVMVLDNAVKFTPHDGEIYVSVDEDGGYVRVIIRDEGVGIPKVALPHIFDRFFHVDEVGEELFGGLGLGLAITRQVIEQHGGKIEVESKEGEGSTFRLYLSAQVECQEYSTD